MRGEMAALFCDAEDRQCGAWDCDYYTQNVSTVDGVRITDAEPAPGWVSKDGQDLCPQHAKEVK